MKIYLLLISMLFFSSCMDKIDSRALEVNNNSNKKIYTIIHKMNIEDDTINAYGFLGDFVDSITSNTIKSIDRPIDMQWYMRKSFGHKFRLYIIEKDTVNKYGWKGLEAKKKYNKKYLIDMDVLDSLNWKVEYNGD